MTEVRISVSVCQAGSSLRNGQLLKVPASNTLYDVLLRSVGSLPRTGGGAVVSSKQDVECVTTRKDENSDHGDAELDDTVQLHTDFGRRFVHFILKTPLSHQHGSMRDTLPYGVAESAPAASAQGYPRGPGAEMKDPWKSSAYVSEYAWFVQHLMPGIFRIQCKSRDLITDLEQQSLAAKERDGPVVHNEYLLSRLEIGGSRSFLLFCQILKDLGPTFDQKRHGLEAVVHQSYDRYH